MRQSVAVCFPEGTLVYSRDGKTKGKATGTYRNCTLESCGGLRIGVRWPDGHITWPCSKGIGHKKRTKRSFIIL